MADESVPFDDVDGPVTWIADPGLFIACGCQQNNKYSALERFARRNDIAFMIPERVYDERGGALTAVRLVRCRSTAPSTLSGLRY
jgi:hypothetical protein